MMGIIHTTSVRPNLSIPLAKTALSGCLDHPALKCLSPVAGTLPSTGLVLPAITESMKQVSELLSKNEQPLWLLFVAFAIAPAICEELLSEGLS